MPWARAGNQQRVPPRVLDFTPMNELRLRFCDGEQPDLLLAFGVHALGRLPTGLGPVEGEQSWLLQICSDRRGIWLTVADGVHGVHVNGRPVQHVALLRAGDSVHVDGGELLLTAANDARPLPPATATPRDSVANLRLSLRGIGGQHHGRSISLEQPRRIGRAADADIRIEGPGIAEQHALIEAVNGQAVLRDAGADVLLNGHRVRQAVLHAGDQIAFDVQHRFVLEGPPATMATLPNGGHSGMPHDADGDGDALRRRGLHVRVPWLLLSALLMASMLALLLMYGAR